MLLHAEQTTVPKQVITHSPKGANNKITLPFGSWPYDLRQAQMPEPRELALRDGLHSSTNAAAAFELAPPGIASPLVTGLRALWAPARPIAREESPESRGLPGDRKAYMKLVEDIDQADTYNSLSIEGYNVTPELVDWVHAGKWNPGRNLAVRQQRDALAARGCWRAFQVVNSNVAGIARGANPGALVRASHRDWCRELFAPRAVAGLINLTDLANYRNNAVSLRSSRHGSTRWETVRDAVPALFDLTQEKNPAVRAVVGHWLFGYIHPRPDGAATCCWGRECRCRRESRMYRAWGSLRPGRVGGAGRRGGVPGPGDTC